MQLQKSLVSNTIKKDTEKGQKIVAAAHLLTRHLSDTENLKDKIRTTVNTFVCLAGGEQELVCAHAEMLIGGAVLAGLISEKNASILVYEMKRFSEQSRVIHSQDEEMLSAFFEATPTAAPLLSSQKHFEKREDFYKGHNKGHNLHQAISKPSIKDIKTITPLNDRTTNKISRQDTILNFINERKSAVIKDIVGLLPDVSEKTIQRELNVLIDTGRITKRGSKRWSIYMAVNSLL